MRHATLTLATVLAFACSAMAETPNTPIPAPLKEKLKESKDIFEGLISTVNDPTHNAQSASDSATLAVIYLNVKNQVSAAEQSPSLADYRVIIQKEADAALSLQRAFEAGDNARAVVILKDMDDVRRIGPEKFLD